MIDGKKNKPATPPKPETDSRGPRPDPFASTTSETKWITPSAKKTEKVIIEPETPERVEPEPEPVIEQVIDEPEQAQQTSADVTEDEQKEIDANAVNDFADALSDSCKRVALDEINIQKDDVEGETIITPDFVEETLIQPIQRADSMKNRIEGKTLFDYTEPAIEKVTETTQEVEAFIEEEMIAPIERQESLKNRVEGKTFEEYEKAQKEADDLADFGKEIEAALNELESSQIALDSVRQENMEATIEAVTKPFESAQYSSLADAPIIYDDLDEEYFSARSSVVSPPSTKFDTAESRDVFSNENSRNDELEEEDIEDEIIDAALQSNSIEEDIEGLENDDLCEPQECGIMKNQEAPSIQKIHLRNVVDAPKDEVIVEQVLTSTEEEPGNIIDDYDIQSHGAPAEEMPKFEHESLERKEDQISVQAKTDITHHGLIEIIPKDGSEIITKQYEVIDRSQSNAPEDICDYTSEAQESSQTDVEDFKTDFPTEIDVLSEPDSRESYHPLESMIRHLSLDVNMDEALVPEILEPVVQIHEESKCKQTLDELALSLADDFENKNERCFRHSETPSAVEEEKKIAETPKKELEKCEESEVNKCEVDEPHLLESAESAVENICHEYVPNPETYVPIFDYSRPSLYEEQKFERCEEPEVNESKLDKSDLHAVRETAIKDIFKEYVPNPETYVPVFDYSRPAQYEEQIFEKCKESEALESEPDSEKEETSQVVPVTHENVENFFRSISMEKVNEEPNEMIEKESYLHVYDYSRPAPFEEKPISSEMSQEACDLENNDECEYDSQNIRKIEEFIEENPLECASPIVDFEDPVASSPVYDAVDLGNNDEPFGVVEEEYIPVYDYSRPAPSGDLIMVVQDDFGTKIYMPEIGTDEISVKVLDLEVAPESTHEPSEDRVEKIIEEIKEPVYKEIIEADLERPTHENVENFFRSISSDNINKLEDEQSPIDKIAHQLSLDVEVGQATEPKGEIFKVKDKLNDEDIDRFASEMVKQVLACDDLLESDKEEEKIDEKSSNIRKLEVSIEKVREDEIKKTQQSEPATPEVEVLEIDGEYYAYEVRRNNKYVKEPVKEDVEELEAKREESVKMENYTSEMTDNAEDLYRESSEDESSGEEDSCPKRVSFSERPAELIGTQAEPTETVADLQVVNKSNFSEQVTQIEQEEVTPTFDYCLSPEVREEPPIFDITQTTKCSELPKELPEAADIQNNDEKDYETEPSEDMHKIKHEVKPTEGIEDFQKFEEQDHIEVEDDNECSQPDLENNDENEYIPVFDYSRTAPQEEHHRFVSAHKKSYHDNEAATDENNNETFQEPDTLEECESLEHLTQDHVENFFKSFFKPSPQPIDTVEYESEEEISLSDEEKALEEEIKKANELEQLESHLDKLENQYLDGEEQDISLPQEVESFIEKLRATTPTPAEEPEPKQVQDPKDMTPDERLKLINKDILGFLEPVDVPVA
ncbi:unnamed protein product [Oikopleura dioica]|uniref:Uncharacterized protein n=1 Tax=Oikopleura dioica TaxID=34765 RepID=E4YGT1_OIKDI|nr:unnamed protein product [Oikopleura dioica]